MVKLFITQCVISLFGNVLALAGISANSSGLIIATGVFSILFYLFLVYMEAWSIGSSDKPSIDGGRARFSATTGILIGLCASIPNIIFAATYLALHDAAGIVEGAISTICGMALSIFAFTNGMYMGIMSEGVFAEGFALNNYGIVFFLINLPAIITVMLGYIAGVKDFHLTRALLPLNAEEVEIKRDQKREKESDQ
jgi:hypothetical protein